MQTPPMFVLAENDLDLIEQHINQVDPHVLIIDSIQTVFHPAVQSAAGSVAQVREATAQLMRIAKGKGICTFIVGHVTKEGSIAGPRMLEHMVDAVLYFEGERHNTFRILRCQKPFWFDKRDRNFRDEGSRSGRGRKPFRDFSG